MFHLDDNLHDTLLDELTDFTLNDEMTALVEACHLLDIKVTVDFIPRVTARNSEIIHDHPEWVYWIEKDALEEFAPPHIPELGFFEDVHQISWRLYIKARRLQLFLKSFPYLPMSFIRNYGRGLSFKQKIAGKNCLN